MTIERFWEIVDRVHRAAKGSMDKKCDLLRSELRKLPPHEVQVFEERFSDCEDKAYTWELWAAAYIIGGGCSDDAFSDFRSSLISMGRDTFERAVASPASLAQMDLDPDSIFYEGYQYIPAEVYEDVTGEEMPARSKPHPANPSGQEWKEEDVARLFPDLARKYGYEG